MLIAIIICVIIIGNIILFITIDKGTADDKVSLRVTHIINILVIVIGLLALAKNIFNF